MNDFKIDTFKRIKPLLKFRCAASVLLIAFLLMGCTEKAQEKRSLSGTPVTTDIAGQKDVPINITAIGTARAYSVVNIVSRADGQITQIRVKEGQDVKKGQILFIIDDMPYKTALESAQSNLSQEPDPAGKGKKGC